MIFAQLDPTPEDTRGSLRDSRGAPFSPAQLHRWCPLHAPSEKVSSPCPRNPRGGARNSSVGSSLRVHATIPHDAQMPCLLQMNLTALHCLGSHLEARTLIHWHGCHLWGTSRASHSSQCLHDGELVHAAAASEVRGHAGSQARQGLTPLCRLQGNPKAYVSMGEASSGSVLSSRRGLKTWSCQGRNAQRCLATRTESGLS